VKFSDLDKRGIQIHPCKQMQIFFPDGELACVVRSVTPAANHIVNNRCQNGGVVIWMTAGVGIYASDL
jgi:hypothetical protein